MMSQTLTVAEVARRFAECVDRVANHGERFVLVQGDKPVAELRPPPVAKRLVEFSALFSSLPHLSPTEAAQFGDDLTTAREALARAEGHDPWRS